MKQRPARPSRARLTPGGSVDVTRAEHDNLFNEVSALVRAVEVLKEKLRTYDVRMQRVEQQRRD
ncbi:MAG TPA: hypothetical protein VKA59_00880 [Vicinamibacterales bacterium]|nr:hypothetical protein [Vicinamibacterales bacterium]